MSGTPTPSVTLARVAHPLRCPVCRAFNTLEHVMDGTVCAHYAGVLPRATLDLAYHEAYRAGRHMLVAQAQAGAGAVPTDVYLFIAPRPARAADEASSDA